MPGGRRQGSRYRFWGIGPPFDELRNVRTGRELDSKASHGVAGLIVFIQALTETMCLDANNGIAFLIEVRRSTQSLHGHRVFLYLVALTTKILVADESKESVQVRRAIENPRSENRGKFSPFPLIVARRRCHANPIV
jgi:hypothetical protein